MGVTPDKDLSSIVNSGQTPATSETPAQSPVPAPVHKVGQHKPQNNASKPQQSKQLGTCKSECYESQPFWLSLQGVCMPLQQKERPFG